jgi:hypothetical protein
MVHLTHMKKKMKANIYIKKMKVPNRTAAFGDKIVAI